MEVAVEIPFTDVAPFKDTSPDHTMTQTFHFFVNV